MIVFSIIGTLIGAGFASGQEIYLFFYRYGIYGILGLELCSTLMGIVIYRTFSIIFNSKINTYEDFLNKIFKSKILIKISNTIINSFLLFSFYIMISGFGTYFEQRFEINSIIGAIIISSICFIVLIKDIEGVKKVNSIVVPILIFIVIIIGIFNIKKYCPIYINTGNNYIWILRAIVYCSYNIILLVPVLVNLSKYIKSKKQIIAISSISAIVIFILAFIIFSILANTRLDFSKIQMPAVYVIDNNYSQFSSIYGIVILLSIFSTAISIGISFLNNIARNKQSFPQVAAKMCISGVAISFIGFSNLVKILFPIFGYLGIVEIIYILKSKK